METIFFQEKQSMRNNKLFYFILLLSVFFLGVLIYGLVMQLGLDKPFGNKPLSDKGLIIFSILMTIVALGLPTLMYKSTLVTTIDNKRISYKYKPFQRRTKQILFADIDSYEVKQYSPIGDYGGWGLRYNFSKKSKAYNVSGNMGIEIALKSGKKILIGTQKPDEIKSVMEKVFRK
jgi:hypothetical protein